MKKSIQLAALIGAVSMFSACSDDVTEVYNGTTGMSVLGEGEKLSKQACDESNIGEMLYVTDESAAFFCNGEKWETLKGEDGKDGNTCSVKQNKDKSVTTITCETEDGEVSYDVKNGKNGKDGKDGDDGYSCSAKQNSDKTVTTITCETKDGKVSYKVRNGADGGDGNDGSGCKVVDNGDGAVNIVCGEGKGESSTEVFKAMCGKRAYDPEQYECRNYELYLLDKRDGNLYKTVVIGEQEWMAENVNYDLKAADPDKAKEVVCGGIGAGSSTGDCETYGRLYVMDAATSLCPDGWHLPSKAEFEELVDFVGGEDVAGVKLRSKDTWHGPSAPGASPLIQGVDEFGFNAISTGEVNVGGTSGGNVGQGAELWTSDEGDDGEGVYFGLYYATEKAHFNSQDKMYYKGVRCLKD